MTKIFLTGATGYIGGDLLYQLSTSSNSKYSISALVRTESKVTEVAKAYPNVRVVKGDLDDLNLVEEEARNADIVLHLASTKHLESTKAIQRGLVESKRQQPACWIQIGGGLLLAQNEVAQGIVGVRSDKIYDDLADVDEIHSVIKDNPHREVDNFLASQDSSKVKSALIVGPHFYGTGRGPINTRSMQAPDIVKATLKLNEGFRLEEGKNSWSYLHVQDLSDLIVLLIEAAVDSKTEKLWGHDGIYIPENGSMEFGELNAKIASEAHKQGLIPDPSITKVVDAKEADTLGSQGAILWGTNSLGRSTRARSLLGWKPSRPSLADEVPDLVRSESKQ